MEIARKVRAAGLRPVVMSEISGRGCCEWISILAGKESHPKNLAERFFSVRNVWK